MSKRPRRVISADRLEGRLAARMMALERTISRVNANLATLKVANLESGIEPLLAQLYTEVRLTCNRIKDLEITHANTLRTERDRVAAWEAKEGAQT